MTHSSALFAPFPLNKELTLKNRIIMAPMTRNSANADLIPTAEMAQYYARRADAGLIITEGTIIGANAKGYTNVPGIFTHAQIEGWRKVTDAVHVRHGHIFSQIWHTGRVSHPHFLDGQLPLSPSETVMTSKVNRSENLMYGKSRAATLDEIQELIADFATAAANAMTAGFDGIEIHGANGYLIDQFLHYHTNHRTDEYGGSAENMARFALEVVKACGDRIGYQRVGIRLSPGGYLNEIVGDVRDAEVFKFLLTELNQLSIAYVHTGNFNDKVKFDELGNKTMTEFMRSYFVGPLVACGGYSYAELEGHLNKKDFDLIAVGRPFIANADLISKWQNNVELQPYDAKMLAMLD